MALLAHLDAGIVGSAQTNPGVLPARFTMALGFWHPQRRRTIRIRMPSRPILVAGSLMRRCVRRRARGRRVW